MTERWQEYFSQQKNGHQSLLELAVSHWSYHQELYFNIRRSIAPPAKILDIGCGHGFSDIYLQGCGYQVTGIDNDQKVVDLARKNAEHFDSQVRFEMADASGLSSYHGRFDLVFSVGVIEHFDRETTVSLLKEQARCAEEVLAVIPTKYTKYSATITDERIYTLPQLRQLLTDAGLRPVRQFGYGNVTSPFHDLVKKFLPGGLYGYLQYNRSYAMEIACLGRK